MTKDVSDNELADRIIAATTPKTSEFISLAALIEAYTQAIATDFMAIADANNCPEVIPVAKARLFDRLTLFLAEPKRQIADVRNMN